MKSKCLPCVIITENKNFERKQEYIIFTNIGIQLEIDPVEFDDMAYWATAESGFLLVLPTSSSVPSGRLFIISLGLPAKTELTRDICQRITRKIESVWKTMIIN